MNELDKTIWVAKSLFDRGLVTGSTGNISFKQDDIIYISESGGCFGLLNRNSFAKISLNGEILEGKPSKEWPIHYALYKKRKNINSIIHTHSISSTIFSCVSNIEENIKLLYEYTPYLFMKTKGNIAAVDYAAPGTKELFDNFDSSINKDTDVYILKNHGIVVAGNDVLSAFYLCEEFEQSSRIAVFTNDLRFNKMVG